jgi:hypothetical protein
MKKHVGSLVMLAVVVSGCTAKVLKPEAARIRVAISEPPGCEYLGEVTGAQGNFLTGAWTSNESLETGARNDMKNKALVMGGNVIVMLANRAGQTGSVGRYGGGSQQTNVAYSGAVYRCPEANSPAAATAPAAAGIAEAAQKPSDTKAKKP